MKIDKAIKALTFENKYPGNLPTSELREAHQLGIEALKFYEAIKIHDPKYKASCLPGETDNKITIEELEEEGYSCGDCSKIERCRSLGVREFSFLCSSFDRGD